MQFVPTEVTLDGLDQKTSAPMRVPGKLEHAINVEYDKTGALNKRLGYSYVDLGNTVNLFDDDAVFVACTTFRGELVVFSYDHLCSMGSRESALRGTDALIYRGPGNRVHCSLEFVTTANLTRGSASGDGF